MKLYLELNEPGSGSIKLHASDKLYNSVTINQFVEFLYRGMHRGGFLVERIRETIVGAGEGAEKIKEVSGRGPLALLDDAIVWDWQTDDKEQIRHFTDMPKAAMLYNLLTESQTVFGRNCYPELTWDFTETHDSNGLEWTDSESLDFRVGTSLLDVLRQIASLGIDFSIEMDTNQVSQTYGKFILHAYRDGLGTNRADTVIFRPGKNCIGLSTELVGSDIRNAILGSFPDKTYPWVYSQDATSQNLYRRREGFLTIQSSSPEGAQLISDTELSQLKSPQISVALKVSDAEGYKVFIDYNLGDIVSYEDDSGTLHPYRIVAMELSWEENSYADVILTLNSAIEKVDFRVAKESIRTAGSSLGSVLRSPLAGVSGGTNLYLHETDTSAHHGSPVPEAENDFQIATFVEGILRWVRKSLADIVSVLSTETPTPNAIPRADTNGKLDSWVTPSSGPSFTEGSIPFASVSGELTEDNSHLFWEAADNRLILGSNSGGTPTTRLTVVGNNTEPTYGPNLLTNGDFATNDFTGWTAGANWSVVNYAARHTPGSTEALSQQIPVTGGTTYQIEWTDTGGTAGSYIFQIGTVGSRAYFYWETAGAKRTTIVASGTGSQAFSIIPTSDYNGSIDNITVRAVTAFPSPVVQFNNTDGTEGLSFCSGGTGLNNLFIGEGSGTKNTTGFFNSAVGSQSLYSNTTGYSNSAVGRNSLYSNTTGFENSTVGVGSLSSNTTGYQNTAVGRSSLYSNTTGFENSALGTRSLYSNTTGYWNSALGARSLYSNTEGHSNSAVGLQSLYSNTKGHSNSAVGTQSLYSNTTSYSNAAVGRQSLYSNTTGSRNSAMGRDSLYSNTTGYQNSALGYRAGMYTSSSSPNQTSNNSVYLGAYTKALNDNDTNEIVLGANNTGFGSNTAAYGNSNITKHLFQAGNIGIGTTTPGGGSTVGTKVVSIANGTAPVGGVANQVSLYSKDVSNSAELWGMDEAGNTVQLTPHPSEFLDALPTEGREYPWAYSAENRYLGKKIYVDMMGAIRAIERLSGEKFIYIEDIPEQDRLDWDAEQEKQRILKQEEVERAEQAKTNLRKVIENLRTKILMGEDETGELDEEITYLERELDDFVIPEVYIPKPPPRWMVKRGVKTKLVQTTKT